ncbi:hypothetical protein B0J11DRAFT_510154 [Dendryphion nanum]|uniref:Uncharacterized protein n=1 Tax=Dendryphion nanum TaxID=256645 RepID=A0A9P9DDD1_9PLEO|nr:hypothetical protein B0J11DRAFT_510154 [Dendryphion nanum]
MSLTIESHQKRIIHRYENTSDESSPWDGIAFAEPVGSDVLADLLKKAYPYVTKFVTPSSEGQNLRQRKHLATIDFLRGELERMKASISERELADAEDAGSPSVASLNHRDLIASSHHSISSCSSPSTPSLPSPQLADRDQHLSELHPDTCHSSQYLPGSTTFVFSAVDGRAMLPKTKRKMTSQERESYKKTRIRGACKTCKRTKARCTHSEILQSQSVEKTAPKRPSQRRVSNLDQGVIEAAKTPMSDSRSSQYEVSMNTVLDDSQSRSRTVPISPQSLTPTDIPTEKRWAPGIAVTHNELYVHNNWNYEPPIAEPYSPGSYGVSGLSNEETVPSQPGFFQPSQYNSNPETMFFPNQNEF